MNPLESQCNRPHYLGDTFPTKKEGNSELTSTQNRSTLPPSVPGVTLWPQ
jgi:hypothetical protein